LLAAIAWYDEQEPGLGRRLNSEVEHAVASVLAQPRSGTPAGASARRVLLKRFPFSVVYRVSAEELLVVAVAHHRRRPAYWRGRGSK
jgi:hypothetical protein